MWRCRKYRPMIIILISGTTTEFQGLTKTEGVLLLKKPLFADLLSKVNSECAFHHLNAKIMSISYTVKPNLIASLFAIHKDI